MFKNIFYLFLVFLLLSACQSLKDGLTGKKQNNQDEFLVEKKNPLVLPPEFDVLPEPKSANAKIIEQEEIDLTSIFKGNKSIKKKTSQSKSSNSSLEKIILEKIKSN